MAATSKTDRVFNPHGRRHYRKTYDLRDLPVGMAIVVGLLGIGGWVVYRGAHPDPSLLALDVVPQGKEASLAPTGAQAADRGPFPKNLALEGWKESQVRTFDPDTLYVKINGRAGYYKSFGVQALYFMSLEKADDPSVVVDLELYDHGASANAVGAYNGERGDDSQPEVSELGLAHYSRNAMYLTRGRLYLRAVGSDESPPILAQLKQVRARFEADVAGDPLPWSYALFIGKMGFAPGAIAYFKENAFNFSFAEQVNVARLKDDTELFVVVAADDATATRTAAQYIDGFKQYGEVAAPGWIQDRYIQTMATARSDGRWVYGVRGAPSADAGRAALRRLEKGLAGFPVPKTTAAPPAVEAEPPAPDTAEQESEDDYAEDTDTYDEQE